MEKICILIPNYNNDKYINETLDSIFRQEDNYLFKIIICDDGSTDNSIEIINSYILKYPNKIELLINKTNCGLLYSTIKLYEKIETPYFTVLDSDDYWINNSFLIKGVNFLEANPDYSIYGTNTFLKDGEIITKKYLDNSDIIKNIDFNSFSTDIVFTHTSSTIFRNNFFNKNIIKYLKTKVNDKIEQIYEGDSFRNICHYFNGKAIINFKITTGVYRINLSDSRWTSKTKIHQTILQFIFFIEMYIFSSYKYKDWFFKKAKIYNVECIDYYKNTKLENVDSFLNELFLEYNKLYNKLFLDKQESFALFLPSRSIGGAEYLFINIAIELSNLNYKIYYIDYQDGFAKTQLTQLTKLNINFIEYKESDFSVTFNEPINFIVPFTMLTEIGKYTFLNQSKNKLKMLYYVIHPKSFFWLMGRGKLDYKTTCRITYNIKNDICFMDNCCSINFRNLYANNKYNYVTIFTSINNTQEIYKYSSLINENINIGWLGRLDEDKIFSVINILDNLNNYNTKKIKNFYIIGSGNSSQLIDKNKYKNINIIFTGTIINEDKIQFLIDNFDISFSMGTSAIECASLKIPTIVPLVFEKYTYISNGFTNFFELSNYNLGCYDNDKSIMKLTEFNDILDDIYIYNCKEKYAISSFNYYNNNHTSKKSINALLNFFL